MEYLSMIFVFFLSYSIAIYAIKKIKVYFSNESYDKKKESYHGQVVLH